MLIKFINVFIQETFEYFVWRNLYMISKLFTYYLQFIDSHLIYKCIICVLLILLKLIAIHLFDYFLCLLSIIFYMLCKIFLSMLIILWKIFMLAKLFLCLFIAFFGFSGIILSGNYIGADIKSMSVFSNPCQFSPKPF